MVVQVMEGMYKVQIFRPFSVKSLIPIVVPVFHTQPILQCFISIILRRIISAESERPGATIIIIEITETFTCESIPHLLCRFCLNGVKCRIFVIKEYLSFHLEVFMVVLMMQAFLIYSHRLAMKLRTGISERIIKLNEELFHFLTSSLFCATT